MIFIYNTWDSFCKRLHLQGIHSIPAQSIPKGASTFLVLKHDVETNVRKAYEIAKIESKYNHRGSYYTQAYLLNDASNIKMLHAMQKMGHEISYHYDVMDSCQGDLSQAILEFEANRKVFENNGFLLKTLCQHGNPIVKRVGYTSNRDFFRSKRVQALYPELSDIMVDFQQKNELDYIYYSDAGRAFKLIYDPINNDKINSEHKNIPCNGIESLFNSVSKNDANIISIHTHRWEKYSVVYIAKSTIFKALKYTAKACIRVSFLKKIIHRYYYLAKKM